MKSARRVAEEEMERVAVDCKCACLECCPSRVENLFEGYDVAEFSVETGEFGSDCEVRDCDAVSFPSPVSLVNLKEGI